MIPVQIKLTPGQHAILEEICQRTGEKKAELLRRLLAKEAEVYNLVFPDDTPSNDLSIARAARKKKSE